ncbi:F-box/LRR-repeat protein At4g14103-like isoform X2 [Malania oleifera]|uniref:F-box/LRR-repeat protein At4g14103-like isoform X2 n=1 Tax=Malania oleifera TaxID=397392 RepID=UPI0025AEAE66|nr:F-box/LRR-repeat protein At4g14103-like isoform X2 [Malania oleifera]
MGSIKRKKLCEGQDVGEAEDRISNLPDCILHHVLSFLPMKDAVGTSLLSTRWRHLWTSLPNIDLDDMLYFGERCDWYPLETTSFVNFVERVLALHDMSNMKRFRLSCRVCFNASCVNAWVSSAVRHKAQELNLCLFVNEPFMLPPCVFSYDYSTQKLFSSCPMLQELAIVDCEWMDLRSITISIPTLTSLTIDDLPCFGSMDDINDCEIRIHAANLISLKYIGHLSNDNILGNLSSLVFASVHIPNLYERRNEIAWRGVKLLRGLHKVKSVNISNGTIKSFFLAENLIDHFPIFQHLIHLELSMEIEYHALRALIDLFHSAPNLESLVFSKGLDPHMCLREDDWNLEPVHKPFLSHLRRINLQNFHGKHAEMCLLKFLLKYAPALERINVSYSGNLYADLKLHEEVTNQLQMLAKGTAGCIMLS